MSERNRLCDLLIFSVPLENALLLQFSSEIGCAFLSAPERILNICQDVRGRGGSAGMRPDFVIRGGLKCMYTCSGLTDADLERGVCT